MGARYFISIWLMLVAATLPAQNADIDLNDLEAEFAKPSPAGDATANAVETTKVPEAAVRDPLRPFNRAMFTVNDKLYFWALKPIGKGWSKIAPEPARKGIRNFFSNLRTPVRSVNAALQGKWEKAGTELERFTVNTTFGFLGFDDAAAEAGGAVPSPEDTGQTLAVWQVGAGWYVVWPVFGPSTVRDTVGLVGDKALDPVSYTGNASFPVGAGETVNATSLRIGEYEELKRDALDPYSYLRDIYLQNRRKRIEE